MSYCRTDLETIYMKNKKYKLIENKYIQKLQKIIQVKNQSSGNGFNKLK